jgi:DNA-directed RNA polymerase specialized sigma24 family protein
VRPGCPNAQSGNLPFIRFETKKTHRYRIEAEDVVQDTFAGGALDELQDDRPLRAWLFRIDHNRALDPLRSRAIRGLAARVMAQRVWRRSCNSELPMAATVP